MISFYPGPSKLREGIGQYLQEAFASDILTYNHRNAEFVTVIADTVAILKDKLAIPEAYEIYFVNSATECWQIISQSLVIAHAVHLYNGAFGQRWMEFAQSLGVNTTGISYAIHSNLPIYEGTAEDLICITNCETSNGTYISGNQLKLLREANPRALIAVDATSCMAGVSLPIALADVWFASVQKCFGLPSGLGIMVCSPAAVARAKALNHRAYYNSMVRLHEKMQATQTNNTPNMLGIYMLGKVMQASANIAEIEKQTILKAEILRYYFRQHLDYQLLIPEDELASSTVIAVKGEEAAIQQLKIEAKKQGFLLGNGYGDWAKNTFRIANFPAHSQEDIKNLISFFKNH